MFLHRMEMDGLQIAFFIFCITATAYSVPVSFLGRQKDKMFSIMNRKIISLSLCFLVQQVNCDAERLRSLQHLSLESLESKEISSEEVETTTTPIITTPLPPVQPVAMADSTPHSTHPVVTISNSTNTTKHVETTLNPQTNVQAFDFTGTGSTASPFPVNTPALESPIMQTTNVAPPAPYPLERNNSTLPGLARGDNMQQL